MAEKNKKELEFCIQINLLPAEYRKQKHDLSWIVDRRVVWPVVAILVFIVSAFMLFVYIGDARNSLEQQLKDTRAEIEKEKPVLTKIKDLDAKIAIITQKRNALKSIQSSKKRFVILFENISSVLPPNMWLTALQQVAPQELEIRGTTFDFSEVAEYMVKLEKQVSFSTITLITITNAKVEGEDAYSFTIKAALREDLGLEESK